MNTWLYQTLPIRSINDLPNQDALFGFVYKITNTVTGQIYIGKKHFYSERKRKLPKNKLSKDKRKKKYERIRAQSDWLNYWSSCSPLHSDLEKLGEQAFKREIISLACSPKYLNYLELKFMILNDVLASNSYNANIAGRFFSKDIQSNCFSS